MYWCSGALTFMTQQEALDILKMGHNVFLTGSPGSGKTFLLNQYIKHLRSHGVEVAKTASTGIAATHMNGMTIHSWSGMGIKDKLDQRDFNDLLTNKRYINRFENTNVLIIDEVSMIHAHSLDLVDQIAKAFKKSAKPFGGMQVVLCGDFFQLPPVSRGGESANFVYRSDIWQEMNNKICYLTEQHRQSDNALTQILGDIRSNNIGEHTLEPLRSRFQMDVDAVKPVKLYTHNIDVDTINLAELRSIPGELHEFKMFGRGNPNLIEALKKSCLAPETLQLKIGAAVMFVKNDMEGQYVNGTLGTIINFTEEGLPVVETSTGRRIIAEPEAWRIEEYNEVKAEIKQIPLRLAWAITVHKSQGMTLDAAEIDLSKSFVEGMGYVALSRVRTLAGLRLMGFNKIALEVNKEILALDNELNAISQAVSDELKAMHPKDMEEMQNDFLESVKPTQERGIFLGEKKSAKPKKIKEKESTTEKTKKLVAQKLSIKKMASIRGMTEGTIVGHLEKLIQDGEGVDIKYLQSEISSKRMENIKKAFKKVGSRSLTSARQVLGPGYSFEEIRLARLFS